VAGVRSKAHAVDFIAKFFLTPETCHLRLFLYNHFPRIRLLTMRPMLSVGLTAYLLNVKVFVWFNPSILVTGTHPLPKGVERQRCLCAFLVLTPRNWEIGGAS
jgi:hypothetical protein